MDSEREHEGRPVMAEPTTAESKLPAGSWQRDLSQRLAHNATPHDIAIYLAASVPAATRHEALAFLHQQRGNAFVQQVLAQPAHASPLSGAMLVSNNPEGLSSPGTIVSAHAKAGPLAAYVHHSNHTRTPLDMFLVVKPSAGPVTAKLSGASAVTGGAARAHEGAGEFAADPNVVVAAANEPHDKADIHNRTNISKLATTATPIKLGTLPAGGHGDPPLFDARYDVELSADAELEVVAERVGGDAAKESKPAIGNTKYELGATNGRAAGMYEGARFASDDTARVSHLPFKKPLTGSKFTPAAPSPKVETAQPTVAPNAAILAGARTAMKTSIDAGAVYVLEHVFRIAPDWLREKGVWDGTHLTTKNLTEDYATIITELKASLATDHAGATLDATVAVIGRHPTVGAGLDAASYGTMFEVAVLIDNDTKQAAKVGLDFLTDASADRAHRPGAVFRGVIAVDGVEHAINNDTASGHHTRAELGAATVEPEQSKYVHVSFQSPGQISAGQELDVTKK